ncbi:hypothetical protein [Pseudomonas fontis]|uniref:Ig-like domain-containing protein n=1 Tax=Pseudomonas fontis TaxID=2942633 RepID=A0ABT5NTK1_9PSED|nr:hypothetical protein [Pseudomonas fontis]MDD0974274.1 hypothetical protein [Pseudomonas fontis]MDD0991499.1 hypothetical protein [Pseudomonas fontis]
MSELPQAPYIPLLRRDTLDPEDMGPDAPLMTYANYAGMAFGDVLYQSWWGLTEDGTPKDIPGNNPIDVNPALVQPQGYPMPVASDFVKQQINGRVFYSYFLLRNAGSSKEESKRIYFGIGPVGRILAPLIKEAHGQQLSHTPPIDVGNDLTIAVVPYGVMSRGDVVKLIWKGLNEKGGSVSGPSLPPKTLDDSDTDPTNNPGHVLRWAVSKNSLLPIRQGLLTLQYEITYADSRQAPTLSAQRTFLIKAPTEPTLIEPSVKGLVGTEINPAQFPDGLRVQVPFDDDMQVDDEVDVYGTRLAPGNAIGKNVVEHLRLDLTHISSKKIELPVAYSWLKDNQGGRVAVRYQYARANTSRASAALALSIVEPLVLPPPTVDATVLANQRTELDPVRAIDGAFIRMPDGATIPAGAKVIAYWHGNGQGGSYQVDVPSQPEPMKFKVPGSVLPANFGKTVAVTYSVNGQAADESLALFVRPLATANHPRIECNKAGTGSPAYLKRADVAAGGVMLTIGKWLFMATTQNVRLTLRAVGVERDIIASRSVQPGELTTGVKGALSLSDLLGIKDNSPFTLTASVSFNGVDEFYEFKAPLSLKLVQ